MSGSPFCFILCSTLSGAFLTVSGFSQTTPPPSLARPPEAPAANATKPPEEPQESPEVEKAWVELMRQIPTVNPPAAWKTKMPSEDDVKKFIGPEGDRLVGVANLARAFAAKFPASPKSAGALEMASDAYFAAIQLGSKQAEKEMADLDFVRLKDPNLPVEKRFAIRARQVQMSASAKLQAVQAQAEKDKFGGVVAEQEAAAKMEAAEAEARQIYVAGARALIKEFPNREEPWAMIVEASGEGETPESKAQLAAVANDPAAPEGVRQRAEGIQRRADAIGKKLELKFTALDGREVDIEKFRGKVVLLDFWATWCGPCVAALPGVKSTYEQLRNAEFEIIGISFDSDKARLEKFVKEKEMPWPQYFDGKYWDNDIGRKYGIASIPSMWLVDKEGILRDVHADVNLSGKVKALLEDEKAKEAAK